MDFDADRFLSLLVRQSLSQHFDLDENMTKATAKVLRLMIDQIVDDAERLARIKGGATGRRGERSWAIRPCTTKT